MSDDEVIAPSVDLDEPVTIFEISVPTTRSLEAAGIATVRDLVRRTAEDLVKAGFDPRGIRELKELLGDVGLALGTTV